MLWSNDRIGRFLDDCTFEERIDNQDLVLVEREWAEEVARDIRDDYEAELARRQPQQAPDAPGWWAFEGHFYWSPKKSFREVFFVIDAGGGELHPCLGGKPGECSHHPCGLRSNSYRYLSVFVGKWYRLQLPWHGEKESE